MSDEMVPVEIRTRFGASTLQLSHRVNAEDVAFNINALEVAKKELKRIEDSKPIPPGTRVRYRLYKEGGGGVWYYGVTAGPHAPVYDSGPVGTHEQVDHVWAYWEGDHSGWAQYVRRHQIEVC